MSRRPFKQVLAGLVSLTLAAPMAPLSAMAQDARPVDPDKPSDGAKVSCSTTAVCAGMRTMAGRT